MISNGFVYFWKRLIAIKSSLIGLCIDVIVLNISTFKYLAVIPSELKEKLHQHLKDNNLAIIPWNQGIFSLNLKFNNFSLHLLFKKPK